MARHHLAKGQLLLPIFGKYKTEAALLVGRLNNRRCAQRHRDREKAGLPKIYIVPMTPEQKLLARRASALKYARNNKAKLSKYYFANKEKVRAYVRANGAKIYATRKRRIQKDPKTFYKKHYQWFLKGKAQGHNRYIAQKLRARFIIALRGTKRTNRIQELIGCPIDLLKLHLQNQFRDGMAWNNHGKVWHIDHIRPCASFDLSKPEEQAKCFHYTNLQPLLVLENIRKGARYQPNTL